MGGPCPWPSLQREATAEGPACSGPSDLMVVPGLRPAFLFPGGWGWCLVKARRELGPSGGLLSLPCGQAAGAQHVCSV